MRLMGVLVTLLSSGCLRQEEAPGSVDASVTGITSVEDAGAFDPCAWNGRDGYCFADMGHVFSGGECVPVCNASPGTNGTIFRTSTECNATCNCRREKFVAPDSPSDPFVIGGSCDEVRTVTDVGVELGVDEWSPWSDCRVGPTGEQQCKVNVSGPFDLRDVATLCWVSSQRQVRALICVVEAR